MKQIALKWKHPKAPLITATQAEKLRDQGVVKKYYEPGTLREMRINKKKSAYFSYVNKGYHKSTTSGHSAGGVGRAHRLFQEAFKSIKCSNEKPFYFYCELYGDNFAFLIQKIEIEKRICGNRYTDIYLELHPACQHYYSHNGRIIIEVTDTHQTESDKIQNYVQNRYTCFEIKIHNRETWHNPATPEKLIKQWMLQYITQETPLLYLFKDTAPVRYLKSDKAMKCRNIFSGESEVKRLQSHFNSC